MLTRDSALWTAAFVASMAVMLGGHFELLHSAFPGLTPLWEARIELIAILSGFISAYLKMSPLPLDPDFPTAGRGNPNRTINPMNQTGTT